MGKTQKQEKDEKDQQPKAKTQQELEAEAKAKFDAEVESLAPRIDIAQMVIDGKTTHTFPGLLPGGLDVTFRTLDSGEERAIHRDIRRYAEGKYILHEGIPGKEEKFQEGEFPGDTEVRTFRCLRELSSLIDVIKPPNIPREQGELFTGRPIKASLLFIDSMAAAPVFQVVYPKSQVFLAAVALALNPRTPEEQQAALGKS